MRQAKTGANDPGHRAGRAARALLGLAAGIALGLAACAAAPPGPTPDTVAIEGCPVPGVEAGCLMLRTGDGQLYDMTAATPPPALGGGAIRLTGKRSDAMSFCMQGMRLDDVVWSYTGGMCGE